VFCPRCGKPQCRACVERNRGCGVSTCQHRFSGPASGPAETAEWSLEVAAVAAMATMSGIPEEARACAEELAYRGHVVRVFEKIVDPLVKRWTALNQRLAQTEQRLVDQEREVRAEVGCRGEIDRLHKSAINAGVRLASARLGGAEQGWTADFDIGNPLEAARQELELARRISVGRTVAVGGAVGVGCVSAILLPPALISLGVMSARQTDSVLVACAISFLLGAGAVVAAHASHERRKSRNLSEHLSRAEGMLRACEQRTTHALEQARKQAGEEGIRDAIAAERHVLEDYARSFGIWFALDELLGCVTAPWDADAWSAWEPNASAPRYLRLGDLVATTGERDASAMPIRETRVPCHALVPWIRGRGLGLRVGERVDVVITSAPSSLLDEIAHRLSQAHGRQVAVKRTMPVLLCHGVSPQTAATYAEDLRKGGATVELRTAHPASEVLKTANAAVQSWPACWRPFPRGGWSSSSSTPWGWVRTWPPSWPWPTTWSGWSAARPGPNRSTSSSGSRT
ncbi:MAG: hypothetical protein AB1758_00970, partial [Candidatus Eremiobacterota bacterium]